MKDCALALWRLANSGYVTQHRNYDIQQKLSQLQNGRGNRVLDNTDLSDNEEVFPVTLVYLCHQIVSFRLRKLRHWYSTVFCIALMPQSFSIHIIAIYPLLMPISWNLTTNRCLAVTGGGSVGECDRVSQANWLLGAL